MCNPCAEGLWVQTPPRLFGHIIWTEQTQVSPHSPVSSEVRRYAKVSVGLWVQVLTRSNPGTLNPLGVPCRAHVTEMVWVPDNVTEGTLCWWINQSYGLVGSFIRGASLTAVASKKQARCALPNLFTFTLHLFTLQNIRIYCKPLQNNGPPIALLIPHNNQK